jgi:uncharacterized phage infection (PIP) family protein YhgE
MKPFPLIIGVPMKNDDRDSKLKELAERQRAQIKNLEDDKAALEKKLDERQREVSSLKSELDKRLPICELKDADAVKIVEDLQSKIRQLEESNKDLAQRLKDKDESNAKIANLCNILLQDKTSLADANRKLAESLDQVHGTIKQLEESNRKLQERIAETRKSLGLEDLKTNF